MIAHTSDCKPCPYCKGRENAMLRRRRIRHQRRKDYLEAKQAAILSGKVVVLTLQDEFTGYFYRYNKHGQMVTLGCGRNYGA